MKRITLHLGLAALVALFTACEGPTGPAGPQGPAGADGATGPAGPQGPTGNANVISGDTLIVDADWEAGTRQLDLGTSTGVTAFGKVARYLEIDVPEITADVVSAGVVMVWFEHAPSTQAGIYTQLPYSFRFLSSTQAWNFHPEILEGAISVYFFKEDLNDPLANPDPTTPAHPDRSYRWVIIPPAAASIAQGFSPEMTQDEVLTELEAHGFRVRDRT